MDAADNSQLPPNLDEVGVEETFHGTTTKDVINSENVDTWPENMTMSKDIAIPMQQNRKNTNTEESHNKNSTKHETTVHLNIYH